MMNPKGRERVLAALRRGHYIVTACRFAGISKSAFYDLYGEDEAFKADVEAAKAHAEDSCLEALMQEPSWQARAWVLERRYGKRWAKKAPDVVIQQVAAHNGLKLPDDPLEQAKVFDALAERARARVK